MESSFSIPVAEQSRAGRGLRLQILGPLRIWHDDVEVDPGPRQQAALLVLLLARPGRPIGRAELIDLIWDDAPPASALNVVQKYVGALRRVLEPGLSPRAAGSHLHRRGDGYLFRPDDSDLDLVTFRDLVAAARQATDQQQPQTGLDLLVEALALWRGPAGEGVALALPADPIFVALNREFLDSCTVAADLGVRLGQPKRVLPALRRAAAMAPLDEQIQACLVTTLACARMRSEALETLQAVSARLADELGLDPGPALRAAQQQILAGTGGPAGPGGGGTGSATSIIGRTVELGELSTVLGSVFAGGTGVVVVDGEPGVGKTQLLTELTGLAERAGALAVWGACLDGNGTPSMWPWVRLVSEMLAAQPVAEQQQWLAGAIGRLLEPPQDDEAPAQPDSGTRFRLFEQVVGLVGRTTARQPVVIVIDDLQWADAASLELFSHLAGRLPPSTVIVGALRDRAPTPGPDLSRHLAAVSRLPDHHRFHLDPLSRTEVAELVRRETGRDPGADTVRGIYGRTAGNPFFARELSRLLADTEGITGSAVPSTVRDVIRSRTADLGEDVRLLLQLAALVGRDMEVSLLAHAAGIDVGTCLARLEPLAALGVLEPTPGDPFTYRFPHDLVREAIAAIMPPRQAAELHLRIAEALESAPARSGRRIDDESITERLAFHLLSAGPLADPDKTTSALIRAGDRAAGKSALAAAERNLQSAVRTARSAGLVEQELSAIAPLANVSWVQGRAYDSYRELLARAESLARSLGQDERAADFLYMRIVGAFTHHHPDTEPLMRRLIDFGRTSADPTSRIYSRYLQARSAYEHGDHAAALRHMDSDDWTALHDGSWRANPLGDLQVFAPVFHALLTGMGGDVAAAQRMLARTEDAISDDPYAISIWSLWAAFTAEWVGDPAWALRITKRWQAADPDQFFVNVSPPMRVCRCWGLALTADDRAVAARLAAEAEEVVATIMIDPPRFGVTRDYALVAEIFLAAGLPDRAGRALDVADRLADQHDEQFAESLRLLVRAKTLHAGGESADVVRAAAHRARASAIDHGTGVIARRAEALLRT